jgi:hypothetical protein
MQVERQTTIRAQFYATDFATEYFGYETTRYCCIWTVFS